MKKKLSVEIVIPIYNEELELQGSIEKLYKFSQRNLGNFLWKIVIADNASTDKSLAIAKKLSRKYSRVDFVHLPQKGRGRAIKKVWLKAKSDLYAYMDVDLSTDLKYLPELLNSLVKDYDIAIGSRLLSKSKVVGRTLKREILSRGYNLLIKLMFQTNFSDAQCGFKAVTASVAKNLLPKLEDNAWFLDSELLIVGEKAGYKIFEVGVLWVDNPGSTVRVLKTVRGDLEGLWRLFIKRPWRNIKKS